MKKDEILKTIEYAIYKFNKEQRNIKENYEELKNDYIELLVENDKLEANWKELKKWLQEALDNLKDNDIFEVASYITGQIITIECVLAKLEELEKGIANE